MVESLPDLAEFLAGYVYLVEAAHLARGVIMDAPARLCLCGFFSARGHWVVRARPEGMQSNSKAGPADNPGRGSAPRRTTHPGLTPQPWEIRQRAGTHPAALRMHAPHIHHLHKPQNRASPPHPHAIQGDPHPQHGDSNPPHP